MFGGGGRICNKWKRKYTEGVLIALFLSGIATALVLVVLNDAFLEGDTDRIAQNSGGEIASNYQEQSQELDSGADRTGEEGRSSSYQSGSWRENGTSGQSTGPVASTETNASMVSVYLISLLFVMALAPPAIIMVKHIF